MSNNTLPVWRLDFKDKRLHFEMARARTYMERVAHAIRDHKPDDAAWLARERDFAFFAGEITWLMERLRKDAAEKKNEKETGK